MQNFLLFIDSVLGNFYLLLIVTTIFLVFKAYIFVKLITQKINKQHLYHPWLFLILVLIGSIVSDITWVFCLIRKLWIPTIDYRFYLVFVRIAWAFNALQAQSMVLFLEKLVDQSPSINLRQKTFSFVSLIFFSLPIIIIFAHFNCNQPGDKTSLEFLTRTLEIYYYSFIVTPLSVMLVAWKIHKNKLPQILKKQVKVLLPVAIIPYWLSELLQAFPIVLNPNIATNSYSAVCVSNICLFFAIYYCTRRIIALRFLNLKNHVEVKTRYAFINNFKNVLEKLSHATSNNEIQHITQMLFKESFGIPINQTHLYVRQTKNSPEHNVQHEKRQTTQSLTESFIATYWQESNEQKHPKVLIYDEIEFDKFYDNNESNTAILSFLEAINADIFIPIYEKKNITAYIIVERYARINNFYGTTERDEMLVYAGYLGNIINLFQTCDVNILTQQEKELNDELYHKHQEINQYKESIRSFLRTTQDKEIGIIFYQNRRFTFGNKSARDIIQININAHEGHPLSRALRHVARQVEEYKIPIKEFAVDHAGNKLVLSGVPNLEKNNVIITVYYPEISDIIKKQAEHLNDPTQWDYLLYLETTESGKLINKLIPGSSTMLLNFKIQLLKIALSKKAILLEMPSQDLMPTVELIHHISLRDQLHYLKLNSINHSNNETAIKIFGINPLFCTTPPKKSLLEELDENGTLFIDNIHLLSLETQEYLVEFLQYGLFRMYKSNHKKTSNARIICSTNQNLQTLSQEGTFSKELFNILKKNTVTLPSLLTLAEDELYALAEGFTEQSLKSMPLKNILELNESEKTRLVNARPTSIHELKEKVHHLLAHKSKKNMVHEETEFNATYTVSDPYLIQAARLGKHALRDAKIMAMLWNKFKSQSKIAAFLGVNRSSVNRRCKDYHLNIPKSEEIG